MRTRSWVTSLITISVLAPPAQAGTIALEERTWVFTAAPGERNDVTVESAPGDGGPNRLVGRALRLADRDHGVPHGVGC